MEIEKERLKDVTSTFIETRKAHKKNYPMTYRKLEGISLKMFNNCNIATIFE